MKPIYVPKGKAKEYGDLAINIYTGCPHRCFYCFAPNVLHMDREKFHTNVAPREGIVETTIRQLEAERITGKTIHLPENRPMLFCNACGAPMTDEAVEMVMERMEKLKDADTNY